MLGLLFIYFIGKYYHDLSMRYKQNKWLFTILGIAAYYLGGFILAAGFVVVGEIIAPGFTDSFSERTLGFMIIPFGLLSCVLFYRLLEYYWRNKTQPMVETIDSIGKAAEENDPDS